MAINVPVYSYYSPSSKSELVDGKIMAINVPVYSYYSPSNSKLVTIGATWMCSLDDNSIWRLNHRLGENIKSVKSMGDLYKSNQWISAALNYDGTTVAISGYGDSRWGDIFVYIRKNTTWIHQETDVFHLTPKPLLVRHVTISGDGNTIAYGAYDSRIDTGNTTIFIRENNIWRHSNTYKSGGNFHVPCLSKDGSRIVSGALHNDGKDFEIFIKSKDLYESWTNMTKPIHPEVQYDMEYRKEDYPTVMSGNGRCVAIGIYKHDDDIGGVKTYTCTDPQNTDLWDESSLQIILVDQGKGSQLYYLKMD